MGGDFGGVEGGWMMSKRKTLNDVESFVKNIEMQLFNNYFRNIKLNVT
jgi:hypothetical protein